MGIRERKARERERRRQQIMVAAKRVFVDKGLSKTTMEDIAREAELSPGTLYLYFKNKDELYASLSLRVLQYLIIRLEQVHKSKHNEPQKRIEELMNAMFDVYDFDQMMIINLFHLQSSETLKFLSDELLNEIEELSRKSLNMIADIFEEGIKDGVFIDRHPIALADILWSMFSGVILWESSKKIIDERKDFLRETLKVAFEVFKRGCCK